MSFEYLLMYFFLLYPILTYNQLENNPRLRNIIYMSYYHFENSKQKNKKRNSTEFNAWIDSSDRLTVIKGFQVHLICIQCNDY